MNETNPIIDEITSSEANLKNAVLICSYQNDIIKKAISGPILKALEYIREVAEQQTQLKIELKSNDFTEKSGKLDWRFGYNMTHNQNTVRLVYIFDNWGLTNLYYGIQTESSSNIKRTPIFKYTNDNWPWGWEWASDKYINWSGENLYRLLDELSNDAYTSSDFCKNILDNILKASKLLKE